MATALVFSMLLQQLSVAPFPCEAGAEVVVRAQAPSGPLAGLSIIAEWAAGGAADLGVTDVAGELRFVAAAPGLHRLATVRDGVRIIAPMRVLAVRPRWLYGLVCVPLGLALLLRNLRSRQQQRSA